MIQSQNLGKKPFDTLVRTASVYLADGNSKKQTRCMLEEFVLRCVPNASMIEWSRLLDGVMKSVAKRKLAEIPYIGVSQAELDTIALQSGKQARRLAFTLLCISKYWDIINTENNHWVNSPDGDIMKIANVRTSVRRQSLLYSQLRDAGLIRFSKKVDNLNVQVLFGDDEPPVMKITDFRNLGFQYLNHVEGGFFECENCGLTVRDERIKNGTFVKRCRRAFYCKDCATEVHLKQTINSMMRIRNTQPQK
jgi:hypothetical protein